MKTRVSEVTLVGYANTGVEPALNRYLLMNISPTDFQDAFQLSRQQFLDSGIDENPLSDFDLAVGCLTRERLIAEFCCALWESGLSEQADSEQLMFIRTEREQEAIIQLNGLMGIRMSEIHGYRDHSCDDTVIPFVRNGQ